MESKQTRALILVAAIILLTLAALRFSPAPLRDDAGWSDFVLPERIGDFESSLLYYCQNEMCAAVLSESNSGTANGICSECGEGELDTVSLGEKTLLPADTVIHRRVYTDPSSDAYYTAIVVISGKGRRSIHTPQRCLKAQGFTITGQATKPIDTTRASETFEATTLTVASKASAPFFYTYWFKCGRRETPHHFAHVLYNTTDVIFHNARRRWAYISVTSPTRVQKTESSAFLLLLHSAIDDALGASR